MHSFQTLRDLIQQDIGNRGLAKVPHRNLLNAFPNDLENACRSIAETKHPQLALVTGFFIPTARPPAGETDGPLGAIFLARALFPLGIRVQIVTDVFCVSAVEAAINMCGLRKDVRVQVLPTPKEAKTLGPDGYRNRFLERAGGMPTHLIALERVGPSHTLHTLQAQLGPGGALGETYLDFADAMPDEHQDRCHTMRGLDVTDQMSPAHWLFEETKATTIGIGDGGNEIGMGKIPWDVIHANIPNGGRIACRIPTQHLIVCGISNWGSYALAAGVYALMGKSPTSSTFNPAIEHKILQAMVDKGPLVDGVLGKCSATVDGVSWDKYAEVLSRCGQFVT